MKRLGEVDLPTGLFWEDRYASHHQHYEVVRTLGGQGIYHPVAAERRITLVAGENSVWLDLATVTRLQGLAEQVGATFPLAWDDESWTVRFRHEAPPAWEMVELWPGSDRYQGKICLVVI